MTRPLEKAQLAETEEQINAPDFWSQPEKSQKVMQERKRLEEQIGQDEQHRRDDRISTRCSNWRVKARTSTAISSAR